MQDDYQRSIEDLIRAVPEFRPAYDEHMADYEELLPTLLYADFGRFVEAEASRTHPDEDLLGRAFAALEHLWKTYDREAMKNALGTGFLEHFSPDALSCIRPRLGAGLLSMVEEQEAWFADRIARGVGLEPGDFRT